METVPLTLNYVNVVVILPHNMGRSLDDDSKLLEGFMLGTFEGLLMLTDPHFPSGAAPP